MTDKELKLNIQSALKALDKPDFSHRVLSLFATLGYRTDRKNPFTQKTYQFFKDSFLERDTRFNEEKALTTEWTSVDLLFQLSKDEVSGQLGLFETKRVDNTIIETYLFFAIELAKANYSRTALAQITREVNKVFPMPVMIVFKHGGHVTISVINRRLNKKDEQKDVLEKVTLIKDISIEDPHRAHVEILFDLSFEKLSQVHKFTNFVELHNAWQKTLDTKELNKRFYRDLSHWYFWAMQEVTFPGAAMEADKKGLFQQEEKVREHNAKNLIRLLTRILFVWFIKEKKLIPDVLFDESYIKDHLLDSFEPRKKRNFDYKTQGSKYYRAILQNLFFATLNQTVGKREFRKEGQHRNVTNLMRYERYFKDSQEFLKLVEATVPFMNGGLFECLDAPDPTLKGKKGGDVIIYEDGFSDHKDNILCVPDYIFFGTDIQADLSEELGDKKQKDVPVSGLINILKSYKFTVTENTPIEEDVALDPELLGRVFENLLASYNPETKTTARKQTGSFYTPREIVNYMVDESLMAYLQTQTSKVLETFGVSNLEERFRHLIAYNDQPHPFNPAEETILIKAIDAVKILDPACGSGAFPMGILHKLVHILHKLDPNNEQWREVQRQKALKETEDAFRIGNKQERDERLQEISDVFERNADDYGRKLYLIENCIYGVDIQAIATQISKLRFFISLIVDQEADRDRDNFGIRPLPNLETKFVAANTLIGIERPKVQLSLFDTQEIRALEERLKEVRHRLFSAKTPTLKRKLREEDKTLREQMGDLLIADGWGNESARQLAAWDPYDQNASSPFFDPEWMFGVSKGFDVVIGNPPWGAKTTDYEVKYLIQTFPIVPSKTKDSYLYFLVKSLDMLSPNACLSLIIPNTWLLINNAADFRKNLLNYKITEIDDYGDGIFEQATVESSALFVLNTIDKSYPVKVKRYKRLELIGDNIIEKKIWTSDNLNRILLDIDESSKNIFDLVSINTEPFSVNNRIIWGIKPYQIGYGKPPQTESDIKKRIYHSSISKGKDWHPFLVGSNVNRYSIKYDDLEFIKYGPWLMYPSNIEIMKSDKILLRQTSDILRAAFDSGKYLAQNSLFIIHSTKYHLKFITALLNSSLLNFIYKIKNPQKGKVFAEVKPSVVKELPISKADSKTQTIFATIVDYITGLKRIKNELFSFFERLIDAMVYELYFPGEIKAAGCEVLKYLTNLPELKDDWSDEKKLATIEKVYKELSNPAHPVSIAMFKMETIEEIRIIEGKK